MSWVPEASRARVPAGELWPCQEWGRVDGNPAGKGLGCRAQHVADLVGTPAENLQARTGEPRSSLCASPLLPGREGGLAQGDWHWGPLRTRPGAPRGGRPRGSDPGWQLPADPEAVCRREQIHEGGGFADNV